LRNCRQASIITTPTCTTPTSPTTWQEQAKGGPPSRYEIVRILVPTPDVAVAQVRRVALDVAGRPLVPPFDATGGPFSEMALYVLVRRGDDWWLAAGQNTLIR
jgi:hypothetical protein